MVELLKNRVADNFFMVASIFLEMYMIQAHTKSVHQILTFLLLVYSMDHVKSKKYYQKLRGKLKMFSSR